MKTVAVIQARMGSTRLPGKVLEEIAGHPMLVWVAERTDRAELVDETVVATSEEPMDDSVADLCAKRGYPCVRGSAEDVLDRVYQAAVRHGADEVVRITADCPFIAPELIDLTLRTLRNGQFDFCATRLPPPWKRTYPIGQDVEVCTMTALKRAWKESELPRHREHVMPYFYDEEGRFKIRVLDHDEDLGHLRLTVDTPADLELVRHLAGLMKGRLDWSWLRIVDLCLDKPGLAAVNAHVAAKDLYDRQ